MNSPLLLEDPTSYGTLPESEAKHHLLPATVSMLAIGGTIGTGLFFSVANIIKFGPFVALAGMCYIAFIVVIVLELTGELAVYMPDNGLICKFQFVFLSRLIGLANNLIYWISWCLTYALELSIIVTICRFWNDALVEEYQTLLIVLLWLLLTGFNLLPVDIYGVIEFWIALVKVVAILVWILVVLATLVVDKKYTSVWTDGWPTSFFGPVVSAPHYLVGFTSCLIYSSFIFQSVESVAITTGDMYKPHETIPKVIRLVFVRIVVFYVVSVLLLTLTVPFSDVAGPSDSLLSSPFVIALMNCGIGGTVILLTFNFVTLSAIVSAANSNVYFGSRCLAAICDTHGGPTFLFLAKTNADNVPVAAVLVTSMFGLVALLLRFQSISALFNFLLTCCALAGMLMWCLLCFSYIRFSQALEVHGVLRQCLMHRSKWNLRRWSWFAAVNLVVVLASNGLTNYWDFTWLAFCGSYMTPVLFMAMWAYFEATGTKGLIPLEEIAVWDGRLEKISGEE